MGDILTLTCVFIMLFFLGMTIMRVGLYQLSYEKMKRLLATFTKNPLLGIGMGIVATSILQSSSLVMVLTIGFVSVKLLSFKQSIGIMLGANIGTTVTGEILAFSHLIPEWYLLIFGFICMVIPNQKSFSAGTIMFGLGTIFVALQGFESLAESFAELTYLENGFIYTNEHPTFGVVIGMVVSAIIQSSSATIGMTMSFLHEGLIGLPASIAIVLGANVGTCVTSLLAIIGLSKETKLVAMAHTWFNILGVLLFLPLLLFLTDVATLLSVNAKEQLAHISVLFNCVTVLLLIPFLTPFEKFIVRWYGR
ncbi:Na/Pi symporter [Radiobacillus deserti]|uniref:Na/Pi cotransporter family protein n=1 Tax=Radiobacillus deserti TaxID=2594883 RepID=A0A516KGX6_9BACI|nr:Na/Pi symporter [Radiobacillus deserti]QDP40651.1 Na/Pi cotransporter family protein [Radiobacillus deserti]